MTGFIIRGGIFAMPVRKGHYMSSIATEMSKLSSAEEFLDFLEVEYQQSVVNVNRLHILKRFNQYLARHAFSGTTEAAIRAEYRVLLA